MDPWSQRLTKYEKAALIAARAQELERNMRAHLQGQSIIDIACAEIEQNLIHATILRRNAPSQSVGGGGEIIYSTDCH